MTHLARIAARIFDVPLLALPETAVTIASNLSDRFGVEPMQAAIVPRRRADGSRAPLYETSDGIATINVHGELVNKGAWIGSSSGLTSYEGLQTQLRAAASDPFVEGILLDMDSPGGEASGAMETGALVREIAGQKPVVAYVDALAASAGYAIASGASHIVTIPSGRLGSIGVVMLHRDTTEQAARGGVKPTVVLSDDADYKMDGSSLVPLTDESLARLKAQLNSLRDLFYATVLSHRSGMTDADLRALKGSAPMGRDAVASGLADIVGTKADALAYFKRKKPSSIGANMTDLPVTTIAKSDHDKALADAERAALSLGREEERRRTACILGAPEAKGREDLAQHLAFSTDMPAEAAIALLGKAPTSAGAADRQPRLTGQVPNPDVAPDQDRRVDASGVAPWASIIDEINKTEADQARQHGSLFFVPSPVRI